jgi:hypothetical protein
MSDCRKPRTEAEWKMFTDALGTATTARGVMETLSDSMKRDERVKARVAEHVRLAPERERERLRKWRNQ